MRNQRQLRSQKIAPLLLHPALPPPAPDHPQWMLTDVAHGDEAGQEAAAAAGDCLGVGSGDEDAVGWHDGLNNYLDPGLHAC